MADALGLHLHDALGHALDHCEGVIHAEGNLLLFRLVDELGEAAARNMIPGHMGSLAAFDPVAHPESPGASQ